jgi:hypothetical protein
MKTIRKTVTQFIGWASIAQFKILGIRITFNKVIECDECHLYDEHSAESHKKNGGPIRRRPANDYGVHIRQSPTLN